MHLRQTSLLLLLLALVVSPSVAQDQDESQALPDIAPRTVEIRGQLEIHFPALERQPLIGFNPPPAMVDLADRMPFMEPYRQGAADLPPSPLEPPAGPSLANLEGIQRRTGQLEARAGRYMLRHVDARLEHTINRNVAFSGRLGYRGTNGHQPFDFDPDASSSADDLSGRADVSYFGDNLRGGIGLDGFHTSYEMFGANASYTAPTLNLYPSRTGQSVGARAWLRSASEGQVQGGGSIRLDGASFSTDACAEGARFCMDEDFNRSQRTLELDADVEVSLDESSVYVNGSVGMSGVDTGALVGTDLVTAQASAGAVLMPSSRLSVRVGVSVLHTTTLILDGSKLYISPDVRIDFYPGAGLQVFAENRPTASHPSLADIHRENPYVFSQPLLESEVRTVDARAGVNLFRGPASINLEGGLVLAPRFRFFSHSTYTGGYAAGTSQALYSEARIIHIGGEASVMVGGRATANAALSWRNGRLPVLDVAIPNYAPLVGRLMVSVPLAQNRLLLSAAGRYESARHRDHEQTREIGDYAALDVRGTYRINHMMGIVVAIENISAGYLERWDNYPEPPMIISGGLRLSW